MASVNRVILIGNLGRDPELRYMPAGDAVTNLNIATTDSWKDKSGAKQERTEWHRISMFGKQAEVAGQYLKKGSSVYIEGRLQTREWSDKEGVARKTTEIVADRMQMLGGRPESDGQSNQQATPTHAESGVPVDHAAAAKKNMEDGKGVFDDFEDDIPF